MSLPEPECLKPPCGMSLVMGRWSLTQTVPKLSVFAARMALNTSRVQTELARPYLVSFAFSNTSSSVSKGRTVRTGPKTSLWTISESWGQSAMTVGSKKAPSSRPGTAAPPPALQAGARGPLPADEDPCPLLPGSLDEPLDPLDLGRADKAAHVRRRIDRVADPDLPDELHEAAEEAVGDRARGG